VRRLETRKSRIRGQIAVEVGKEIKKIKAEQALLNQKEKAIEKTISDFKREAIETNKKALKYTILNKNMEMNQRLYDAMMSKLKEADITAGMDASNIRIVEKALLPGPSMPSKRRNILLGMVLGLMIGIGLSFLLENLDRTLHTEEDVRRYFDLPVLSVIPSAKKASQSAYGTKE
jgi:uncharacterized protein involved in exopolysaccharide biosynthesis